MDWRSVYRISLAFLVLAALAGALWLVVAPAPSPGVEIYLPGTDGAAAGPVSDPDTSGDVPDALPSGEARININTATADELTALPGIGEVLAARIVDHREHNGPFERLDQIMAVSGIGPKTYEKLRPLTTVGE